VGTSVIFDRDELDLIVAFAGCSLDESPGKNWVEGVGGLPEYICQIARAVKRTGKTTSQAVAIAVSRVKKWATGVGVDKKTQAKATKALAQWEAKKAANKTKTAAKEAAGRVGMSNLDTAVLNLAATTTFNVDLVKQAFDNRQRDARKTWRAANPNATYEDGPQYLYIKEQWTTYLIAASGYGEGKSLYKIPYTVDTDGTVTFGDATEVQTQYVAVDGSDIGDDGTLSDADLQKLMDLCGPCPNRAADRILTLTAARNTPTVSGLQKLLNHAKSGEARDPKKPTSPTTD